MLAGPIDMNNGMFDLRQGPTTRVDENTPVPKGHPDEKDIAAAVEFYNGLTEQPVFLK